MYRYLAALPVSAVLAFAAAAEEDAVQETIIVVGEYLYSDQVNALKTPTPIIDVPQSLSIISADQIAKQGLTSIGDIVDYTPGVTTSMGEGHRDAVVFRGVRSTADFFIDGMRDDVQYYRSLYNLEQVEILRGPNALMFGRGGTGGILNRVTKKGQIGEQFTDYTVGLDTFGGYDLQLDTNTTLNDTSAVRLNAMYESLEGHRDFFDGERIGLNPTAKIMLAPQTVLDLSYEYADHERFIDRGIPTGTDGAPVAAFDEIVFADADLNITALEAHLFRASLSHAFSDTLKGNVSAFYGDYDKSYQNLYASAYDAASTPDRVTLDGYADNTTRQNLILSGNLVGEFVTGPIGHTLIVGAEYIDTSSDQDRYNVLWDTTNDDNEIFLISRPLGLSGGVGINADGVTTTADYTTDLNDNTLVDISVSSLFLQDEIELSKQFDLILGARFDRFEMDVFDAVAAEQKSRTDEEVSPRLGLVYKPQENVSLYGSYSKSFLPRSGEQFANLSGSADQLDVNTYENLEAGVKWDLRDALSVTAAVFEITERSPQVSDNDPTTAEVVESEISGFEAQLRGQLTENWFLSAGYSYLDGEQVDRAGATGLRPRELPEHVFSLWNAYQVSDALGLGIGLTYQDESFINNSNTAYLPAYTRVDASASYDFSETLGVRLKIENLLDKDYYPNAHSTHQVAVGAPLNARLTLTGRF